MSDLNGIFQGLFDDRDSPRYAAVASGVACVASATDVVTLTGSATKTVRVRSVRVSGISTAGVNVLVALVKRSAADTGGTSAALTEVPLDSGYAAASATGLSYTANPTTGAAVGTVASARVNFATAALEGSPVEFRFDVPVVLRGIAEVLAVNLGGVTVTGGVLDATFVWSES